MATRPINPTTVTSILAGLFGIGVVAYLGTLYLQTKPLPVKETAHAYDTAVIKTELDVKNAKSVFALTVDLGTPTQQQSGSVGYNPSELGKQDISRAGR